MKTRAVRAAELLAMIERGPELQAMAGIEYTPEHVRQRYRGWAESWILAELKALIPELRVKP